MEPTTPLTADEMIAALNGSFDYGRDRRHLAVVLGLTPATAEEYALAAQEFREKLRKNVDLWLDAGVDEDGREHPATRKPTMEVQAIVSGYLRTHPALPINFDKGYQVAIPFRIEALPSLRPKEPATYQELPWGKHARIVAGEHEPRKDVLDDAQRLFVGMLFQDWAIRIAKCRRLQCGLYYMLNKPRTSYKRGTLCRRCSSLRSAAERTAVQRRKQHEARLRIAGKAHAEWHAQDAKRQRRLGPLKKYVASELREQNQIVTVKWVTRNLKQIEATAKPKPRRKSGLRN